MIFIGRNFRVVYQYGVWRVERKILFMWLELYSSLDQTNAFSMYERYMNNARKKLALGFKFK